MPQTESSGRLVLCIRTDFPDVGSYAHRLAEKSPDIVLHTLDATLGGPSTIEFLRAVQHDLRDDALIARIDCCADKFDEVGSLIVRRFALAALDPEYLTAVLSTFEEASPIGLAIPSALPRIALDQAGDSTLIQRLADRLGLTEDALAETVFFPHPIYFLRGSLYKALARRHAKDSLEDEKALALGFHALCKSSGLNTTDLSPKRRVADTDALNRYASDNLKRATDLARDAQYRPITPGRTPPDPAALKYIAYYLPQFHAIPENDRWWGTGFTEWTNVTKAAPRFIGHDQPRLPADLGHYDLSNAEVMARQIALARAYGIHGFCFYYYWFNGRTLLEKPLENFLADPSLDMPFCLCWANENWTRRWDGQENEILMAQSHSPRDDLRFIEHIAPYLRDSRYIRVEGKPLLLVYRASLLDDACATADRWRNWCRDNGIGEICLAAVCSFNIDDPRPFGFDLAVEFPPHQLRNMPPINPELKFVDRAFSGEVLDYRDTVLLTALDKYRAKERPFPLLHGVMTGWDNDARRNGRGRVFHHASPSAYANWLRLASDHTRRRNPPQLQYVFINAWNEWAEGAYLEPDRRFGHGYLAATADTLNLFGESDRYPPPQLGSSSGAQAHLPEHLLRRHGKTETDLCRARIAASDTKPTLHVAVLVGALEASLLDTLQSLAEQSMERFSVSIVSRQSGPHADWLHRSGITTNVLFSDAPLQTLTALARDRNDDWLVLLHAGDRLFPHALLLLAAELCARPDTMVVLCDELEHAGDPVASRMRWRTAPTPTRLMCGPRDGAILAVRRNHFAELDGLDAARAGACEMDFLLRTALITGWDSIQHVPEVLIWRASAQHVDASVSDERQSQQRAAASAAYLAGIGADAEPDLLENSVLRIRATAKQAPRVSILILTHNQPDALQRCIETIFANTAQTNYEVIIVDHDNTDAVARSFLDGLAQLDPARIRVVIANGPFEHGSFVNRAASEAHGDFILLLDDDTAPLCPEWLDALLAEAVMPDVGIVGARLLFPDGRLQHAGVIPGMSGSADFPWSGRALDDAGPDGVLLYAREVPAVSGSCMLIRRSLFEQLDGFDEIYGAGFGDFDLCLRARQVGARVVWTPHAALMHETGRSLKAATKVPSAADHLQQRFDQGRRTFLTRWRGAIGTEPLYNSNLSLASRQVVPEPHPALARDPIDWHPLPTVLALPADQAGSGQYRVRQPALAAHANASTRTRIATGYPMTLLFDRLGIDTLHTQRQVDDAQLSTLEQLRNTVAPRVVMDFDDLITEVPKHSYHAAQIWPDIERRVRLACSLSDCITASTEPLAARLRAWHDDVRVIPNGIDPMLWQPPTEASARAGKLRVGWAGGLSHAGDLAVIREIVASLADEVEWVFFGMCLEDMQPHLTEFHHGVPFEDYPAKLASLRLDLALAPLEDNAFNECKSNLRLLEYGALGIPVLASDLLPYRGDLPVQRVDNRRASWIRAIRERIDEREALQRDGRRLRETVLRDWTQEKILPTWVSAWTA